MTKLKVALVLGRYGWAQDFNARGVEKYSRHDAIRMCSKEITPESVVDYDAIFCFTSATYWKIPESIRTIIKRENIPLIIYCCGKLFARKLPSDIDFHYCLCTKRVRKKATRMRLKDKFPIKDIFRLMEGVDTEIFKPRPKEYSSQLRVGWAGNQRRHIKRAWLLKELDYPVKIRGSGVNNNRDRSREPMVKFYNSLDVYVTLMNQVGAGVGLTHMEAMSCGLPVIATDVCSVSKIIKKEWLVPYTPEELVVEETNKKLRLLDKNRKLREQVGDENLQYIIENRGWNKVVKGWDAIFEKVVEG